MLDGASPYLRLSYAIRSPGTIFDATGKIYFETTFYSNRGAI